MSHFLLAWEFGSAFGHLTGLCLLADRLVERGHSVTVVIPEHSRSIVTFPKGVNIKYSPGWAISPETSVLLSYADDFFRGVRSNLEAIQNSIAWWRAVYAEIMPDGVVVDFAPTPLLLARTYDLPRIILGNGYTVHPPVTPSPSLQPWLVVPERILIKREQICLDLINPILRENELKGLDRLASLVSGGQNFLRCFKELISRRVEPAELTIGPMIPKFSSSNVSWPPGNALRAFIYLHSNFMHYVELAQELTKRGICAIVCGSDEQLHFRGMSGPNFVALPGNIDHQNYIEETDIVISLAGSSLPNRAALHGCAQIMFPTHIEQASRAWHFCKQGWAEAWLPFRTKPPIGTMIDRVLEADCKNRQDLAKRLKSVELVDPSLKIVNYLEGQTT